MGWSHVHFSVVTIKLTFTHFTLLFLQPISLFLSPTPPLCGHLYVMSLYPAHKASLPGVEPPKTLGTTFSCQRFDLSLSSRSGSTGGSFSPGPSSSPNLSHSQSQTPIGGAFDGGSVLSVPVRVVPPSPSTTEVELELFDVLDLPALAVCIALAFSVSTID